LASIAWPQNAFVCIKVSVNILDYVGA